MSSAPVRRSQAATPASADDAASTNCFGCGGGAMSSGNYPRRGARRDRAADYTETVEAEHRQGRDRRVRRGKGSRRRERGGGGGATTWGEAAAARAGELRNPGPRLCSRAWADEFLRSSPAYGPARSAARALPRPRSGLLCNWITIIIIQRYTGIYSNLLLQKKVTLFHWN